MLEIVLVDREGKGWLWEVHDRNGTILVGGKADTRAEAKYQGDRALFHLLAIGWKSSDFQSP
jgi:hypothetical protein